ncbi:uncharacterized protein LOC122503050 [Leptopilina heterotoma]|uniref:uncharacterized protein LOC122503050 n=1 Tax=Leptopilina heterotoma TaxID=63436 RepID=UPI001CAA34BD|nr:uncharacterized protein LOC122503050 [Leptopilina heterotoma]
MTMEWITIALCLVLTAGANSDDSLANDPTTSTFFQITPFNISSGVYFEHFGEVRRSTSRWRVAVFLDIGKQIRHYNDLKLRLERLKEYCRPGENWCEQTMYQFQWGDKWEMASELQLQFRGQIEELENTRTSLPRKMSSQLKVRRSVPLLGFLGKIAGPIAGVLNYDDGERYDAAIEDLNQAQSNLTRYLGKQTHIVRSQLDIIHTQYVNQQGQMDNLRQDLQNLLLREGKSATWKEAEERRQSIILLMEALKIGLDHNIKATSTILNAVHEARQNRLHPGIISSNQLEPIMREIQDNLTDVYFPLPGPKVSIDELIRIATISIWCDNHKLKVLIDIPLLERHKYQSFKIHPLPTIQESLGSGTQRAYISSDYDYLIIDEDKRTYLLIHQEEWKECRSTAAYHACLEGVPIYDVRERPGCEPLLLDQPSIEAMRSCTIKITTAPESYWQPLRTLSAWLYSFARPEVITIYCHSMTPVKVNLTGVGMMKLAPGCSVKTKDVTIPATSEQKGQTSLIFETELHLDVMKVSPLLATHADLAITLEDRHVEVKSLGSKMSSFEANSKTLYELEEELEDLAVQKQFKNKHTTLVYGAYGGSMLIIICIILYLCRKPISSGANHFSNILKPTQKQSEVAADCRTETTGNYSVIPNSKVIYLTSSRCHPSNETTDPKASSAVALKESHSINMGSVDTPLTSTSHQTELQFIPVPTTSGVISTSPTASPRPGTILPTQHLQPF